MNALQGSVGGWLEAHRDLDRVDRELLACRALGLTRSTLLIHPETPLDAASSARLDAQAARRRRGEPMAYILGGREFWGLEFEVSPAVLVPRPDTELLVQVVLDHLIAAAGPGSDSIGPRLADLGTGSGAIAIALGVEGRQRGLTLDITAIDRSAAALAVARRNAARHRVPLRLVSGDWLAPLSGAFHVIAANPPYVADGDPHLNDLRHEPRAALAAGPDGLDDLRRISAAAPGHLLPGALLALEHGYDQGAAVRQLLEARGFVAVQTHQDLASQERVTTGRWPREPS